MDVRDYANHINTSKHCNSRLEFSEHEDGCLFCVKHPEKIRHYVPLSQLRPCGHPEHTTSPSAAVRSLASVCRMAMTSRPYVCTKWMGETSTITTIIVCRGFTRPNPDNAEATVSMYLRSALKLCQPATFPERRGQPIILLTVVHGLSHCRPRLRLIFIAQ